MVYTMDTQTTFTHRLIEDENVGCLKTYRTILFNTLIQLKFYTNNIIRSVKKEIHRIHRVNNNSNN